MEKVYVGSFVEKKGQLYALYVDQHVRGKQVERKVYKKDAQNYIILNGEKLYFDFPCKVEKREMFGEVFYIDAR